MKEKKKPYLIWTAGSALVLLLIDQLAKYLAAAHLRGKEDIILIPRVFQLHYLENRGAAFGLFQNQKIVFLVLCVLFLAGIVWFLYKMPASGRYIPFYALASGLSAGAAGNGIDRLLHGYVVDFFYFSLIDFPVFNMADIYVVISSIFLFFCVCFVYREEDFSFMQRKEK